MKGSNTIEEVAEVPDYAIPEQNIIRQNIPQQSNQMPLAQPQPQPQPITIQFIEVPEQYIFCRA